MCLKANRDAHLVTRVSPSFLVPLIHMFLQSPGYYRPQSRLLAASLGKQRDSWAPITRPNRCSGDLQRKWTEKRNGEGREVMRKKGKPRVDGGSKKWINTLMPELRDFIRNPALPSEVGHKLSALLRPQEPVFSHIDSPTRLSAAGLMPQICRLSLAKCGRDG